MKRATGLIPLALVAALLLPGAAVAASNGEVADFTRLTLSSFTGFAAVAACFFLVKGAYLYMVSTGNPATLEAAKRTIRNALLGLVLVAGAAVLSSLLGNALTQQAAGGGGTPLALTPIQPAQQPGSLVQLLLDAIAGFLQNIVQSATKPVLDAIVGFLTSTPQLSASSAVFNLWLVMVGIADSLFALVVALLGLHVMAASSFGFEEASLKELLPRIGLAFLMANTSIFLIDWLVLLCQTLVTALLHATGGIGQAWLLDAFNPASIVSGGTLLVTLVFMAVFLVLAVALLLFYISRLIVLALGAVLSPLLCLVWLLPRMSGFAESAAKAYMVTLFSVFIHVTIIQLASGFLTFPGQEGANPLVSVLAGIALLSVLLKSASFALQLVLASHSGGMVRKLGGQVLNVLSPAPVPVAGRQAGREAR